MKKTYGDVHVSRNPGRSTWKVTQDREVLSNHRTQAAANIAARTEARRDGVDRVTHGRDGRINSKDSFGRDPNPPKDREH